MTLSRMAARCRTCPYQNSCDHKEMEMVGQMQMPATASITQPAAMPVLREQNLRKVKIGADTTITIDLDELAQKMREDVYRRAGLGITFGD